MNSLLKISAALSALTLVACEATSTPTSTTPEENSTLGTPTTTITYDTLIVNDTLIANGDTLYIPKDTVITSDTVVTTPESSELFTNRDLAQTADLAEAVYKVLASGQDIVITTAGVYVISGSATDVTIFVNADSAAKVQIVLDGVTLQNTDAPAIYVQSADKVFVTTTASQNTLKVTGAFVADGETNLDAVIFSRDDLVLNGLGTLQIVSSQGNGVSSKDDLKVTGGSLDITAAGHGLEANDAIAIAAGTITIQAGADGLHAENDEDLSLGSITIADGTLDITATDDGIHATSILQIDGGNIAVSSKEGLESTYILINAGDIKVSATDDGLNASDKSTAYAVLIEINGGTLDVTVSGNDVDGIDSNGDILINGGTIAITCPTRAPSGAFDADGTATLKGGTVTVNGTQVTTLASSMAPGGR